MKHYKEKTNTEIAEIYKKEDGSRTTADYFKRVKNILNRYGQLGGDGMMLKEHHKRIIKDGREHIEMIGKKKYSEYLQDEFDINWDGVRKEIGIMIRYGVI